MSERRESGRIRTFLRGRISYNNRAASMDCLVRDLSPCGARLALEGTGMLPEAFDLLIPQKSITHRCQLRWRREEEVGVIFLDQVPRRAEAAPAADASTVDLLVRVRLLEAENEALRRRLAALTVPVLEDA